MNQDTTPSGILLWRVSYLIECSSKILLSDLQGGAAVDGSGSGRSLGSIPWMVLIFRRDVFLPTTRAYQPAATRLLILMTIPFPGCSTRRSCPKQGGEDISLPSWNIGQQDTGFLPPPRRRSFPLFLSPWSLMDAANNPSDQAFCEAGRVWQGRFGWMIGWVVDGM